MRAQYFSPYQIVFPLKKKIVRYQNCQGISFVSILRALKKLYLESRGRLIWIGEALHFKKIVGKACFSQYYIFFTKYLSTYFGSGQGRNIYCWLPATCARHCTGSCLSFIFLDFPTNSWESEEPLSYRDEWVCLESVSEGARAVILFTHSGSKSFLFSSNDYTILIKELKCLSIANKVFP